MGSEALSEPSSLGDSWLGEFQQPGFLNSRTIRGPSSHLPEPGEKRCLAGVRTRQASESPLGVGRTTWVESGGCAPPPPGFSQAWLLPLESAEGPSDSLILGTVPSPLRSPWLVTMQVWAGWSTHLAEVHPLAGARGAQLPGSMPVHCPG